MRLFVSSLLFLVSAAASFAKEVALFDQVGVPSRDYISKVNTLQAGDEVVFSSGQRFKIKNLIGRGGMTLVFETSDGQVLRLAREPSSLSSLGSTLRGAKALEEAGVRIPKILGPDPNLYKKFTQKPEFVLVEKIPGTVPLHEVGGAVPAADRAELRMAFKDFAKKTAPFQMIGDFRPDQVVWSKNLKQFVLLDYLEFHDELNTLDLRAVRSNSFNGAGVSVNNQWRTVLNEMGPDFYHDVVKSVQMEQLMLVEKMKNCLGAALK